MRVQSKKRSLNPHELIEAAIRDGLYEDKSSIDNKPVYRKLSEKTTKPGYGGRTLQLTCLT